MATQVDINPYPLGKLAPTSGTPVNVLSNYSDLVQTMAKLLTLYAPSTNTGIVYIGRSTLNRSTYAGVIAMIAPGQTVTVPYNFTNSNTLDLTKIYVDVDTTGDKALAVALFA